MPNPIPDQPQKTVFTFWLDLAETTPLAPEPVEVIFTLTVAGSSNDVLHPATTHKVGTDPNATKIGISGSATYQFIFNPTDYGTWRVDVDGFDIDGISVGAQFATVLVDPRPSAIPVA